MAEQHFYIGRGARLDSIEMLLYQATGAAADITGSTVRFQMWRPDMPNFRVDAPATIVSANPARVRYDWASGDTDDDGIWRAQWEETTAGGLKRYYPSDPDRDGIHIHIMATGSPP